MIQLRDDLLPGVDDCFAVPASSEILKFWMTS